jgi:uncharacterized protein (TIGR03067 family)
MRPCLVLTVVVMGAASATPEEKEDRKHLRGTWVVVKVEQAGVAVPLKPPVKNTFAFTADEVTHEDGGGKKVAVYKLDPAGKPAHIDPLAEDGADKGKTYKGIYELKGDTLRLCLAPAGEERPAVFSSKAGEKFIAFELRRDKK